MTIHYTARQLFSKKSDHRDLNWDGYAAWRDLPQLSEIVSLDAILNTELIDIGQFPGPEAWACAVFDGERMTGFFSDLDFVIKNAKMEKYNLLAVAIQPEEACENLSLENFEFVGYDLLDDWYNISSLTNCDGFIESFSTADINEFGLFSDWHKAFDAKHKLLENNPEHSHANTNVIAVWRHLIIGR